MAPKPTPVTAKATVRITSRMATLAKSGGRKPAATWPRSDHGSSALTRRSAKHAAMNARPRNTPDAVP